MIRIQHRYGLPSHPAYIPERQAGLTDRMTFIQRMKNFYLYGVHWFIRRSMLIKYRTIQVAYDLSPEKSMADMMAEAQLWVFYGGFEMDLARPLTPNVIFIASPMLGLPAERKVRWLVNWSPARIGIGLIEPVIMYIYLFANTHCASANCGMRCMLV